MTLPDRCPVCGYGLNPWDDDEQAKCWNCGAQVQPIETWSPAQRRHWIRRQAIDHAAEVTVRDGVL